MNKNIINIIWELVSNDQLESALLHLKQLCADSSLLEEIAVLLAKYHDLSKQIRMGVINQEQTNIEKNKLRLAILEIARILGEQNNKESEQAVQTRKEGQKITQIHYGKGDNIAGNKIINQ